MLVSGISFFCRFRFLLLPLERKLFLFTDKNMRNQPAVYPKDWMAIHPYAAAQPSDRYFVELARRLYAACMLPELPEPYRKKLCLYVAAYLEDVVSGLGLWQSFTGEHVRLYGRPLPFYSVAGDYLRDEVNEEDVRFIVWNTWQKALFPHAYINPEDMRIAEQAAAFYRILEQAYEEAPENPSLAGFFAGYADRKDADRKLAWLFAHTYLTEPSMQPYAGHVAPADRFIVPTGPLALFLYEWMDLLAGEGNEVWRQVEGLYPADMGVPAAIREKSREMYRRFTEGTGGCRIVYLDGYEALHRFLVDVMRWPDDDDHTLPQMRVHRNFVMMADPEKGILLAKDICESIADSGNPMYAPDVAAKESFRLLTEESLCPPDLLTYCIRNGLLPDAVFPDGKGMQTVRQNADFIARHALLYYYRGD